MRLTTLLICLTLSTAAFASPFTNGESVRVRVGDRSRLGIGLRPSRADGAWRLTVRNAHAAHAEVIDVTNGAPQNKWMVELVDGALTFDVGRFVAGHAYRVMMRGSEEAIVYLYAPPRGRSSSHIVFADEPRHENVTEDGIAITPKSAL